jgi:hypothetical protein
LLWLTDCLTCLEVNSIIIFDICRHCQSDLDAVWPRQALLDGLVLP